jgi:hypothetical protein
MTNFARKHFRAAHHFEKAVPEGNRHAFFNVHRLIDFFDANLLAEKGMHGTTFRAN